MMDGLQGREQTGFSPFGPVQFVSIINDKSMFAKLKTPEKLAPATGVFTGLIQQFSCRVFTPYRKWKQWFISLRKGPTGIYIEN